MNLLEIIVILELISRTLTVDFQTSEWFYFEFIKFSIPNSYGVVYLDPCVVLICKA